MRGATKPDANDCCGQQLISIHAPLAGCDRCTVAATTAVADFNPRTPCGVRPWEDIMERMGYEFQSTHPLRGATCSIRQPRACSHFNPRTPCGVRRARNRAVRDDGKFQSTHPLRGATHCRPAERPKSGKFQSTHPLRGATRSIPPDPRNHRYFNPRTPCGVRLVRADVPKIAIEISIHAPLAGCDSASL